MRIGIIGGLGRSGPHFSRLAADAGHEASFHDGEIKGRGARALEHVIDRSELVVIVTDVNSHAAVQLARRRLREQGRSPLLLRRFGLARFAMLLAALNVRVPPRPPAQAA
jgi:hypothetical protein